MLTWARWFEVAERTVAKTELPTGTLISTVFLGIDHAFGFGPPVLWESMAFGGPLADEQWRYASHAAALAGHEELVGKAQAAEQEVAERARRAEHE